jgi:hypothetical protein
MFVNAQNARAYRILHVVEHLIGIAFLNWLREGRDRPH